uniref:Uncharacterized protein LOC112827676 isoform X2 n=1 Tax=Callorhinus ursinus TaxID=34884 RepID=A0A3Q7PQ49_CALUR|nr:uncharacterized protein LOC112827676 isoform X2 [Callorhinus ursinus]
MWGARCRARAGPLSPASLQLRGKFSRGVPSLVQVSASVLACPGLLSPPGAAGGSRACGAPRGRGGASPCAPSLWPEKVVAPSSSSPCDPWGSFLPSAPRAATGRRPRPIPGVPGTPWRAGARQQVQGWEARTAWGSARPQAGPRLPCPTVGSPEAGSSTRRGQAARPRPLLKGAGALGPLVLVALPVAVSPPASPASAEVVGDLSFASSLAREGQAPWATQALLHFGRLLCIQLLNWENPRDSSEQRGGPAGRRRAPSYCGALCGSWVVRTPLPLTKVTAGAQRCASQCCTDFIPRCRESGFSQRTEAVTSVGQVSTLLTVLPREFLTQQLHSAQFRGCLVCCSRISQTE